MECRKVATGSKGRPKGNGGMEENKEEGRTIKERGKRKQGERVEGRRENRQQGKGL